MNEIIKQVLKQTCLVLNKEYETKVKNPYLFNSHLLGHCLATGLRKINLNAKETTGHLVLKNNNAGVVVYGSKLLNGKNVCDFHTWCTLQSSNKIFVIDPSIKYAKVHLKKQFNLTIHEQIPPIIIAENKSALYYYKEDKALIPASKKLLNQVPLELITHLSNIVKEATNSIF